MSFFEKKRIPPNGSYEGVVELQNRGYGALYRAKHIQTNADVLVKTTWDTSSESRLAFEAEVQRKISHSSLPQLIESYYQPGANIIGNGQFYVFSWTGVQTLRRKVQDDGQMSLQDALSTLIPICDALKLLHDPGTAGVPIVHKHISPDSIVIWEGKPMLRDYGLNHVHSYPLREAGIKSLVPGYAAPEQCDPSYDGDKLIDIYGIGATLYYLVTKQDPNGGTGSLTPANVINPSISQSASDVIAKAMAYYPGDRYKSMAELGEALRTQLDKSNGKGTEIGCIIALIVFAILGFFFLKNDSPPASTPPKVMIPAATLVGQTPMNVAGGQSRIQQTTSQEIAMPALPGLQDVQVMEIASLASGVTNYTPILATDNRAPVNFYLSGYFNAPSGPNWDLEVTFRKTTMGYYQLSIGSDEHWYLDYMIPEGNGLFTRTEILNGPLGGAVQLGTKNAFQLTVHNDKGWLHINGLQITDFSTLAHQESGNIEILSGAHPQLVKVNPIHLEEVTIYRLE